MGWMTCYSDLKKHIESEEFKKQNLDWNPNDPQSALSIALRELYNEYNPWRHRI